MRKPPPVSQFLHYPATAATALLAIAVTFAWWAGLNDEPLIENAQLRRGELWRLCTSALPHLSIYHLAFNVYWLWVFGTLIEENFGHLKTAALFLLLAAGSGAADFAVSQGGVGLSGAGYGLFAMVWVLSRRDARFAGAVDNQTVILFIAWFFLCIATTIGGVMAVANVAHGAGAALGALMGAAVVAQSPASRRSAQVGLVVLVIGSIAAAVFGRPYVNFSARAGQDEAFAGYQALHDGRNEEALRWYGDAVRMAPRDAASWYNLGIARPRAGDNGGAEAAYQRAASLDPSDHTYREAAAQMQAWIEQEKLRTN